MNLLLMIPRLSMNISSVTFPFEQTFQRSLLPPVALGGLVVSVLATGPKVRGSNLAEVDGF
jgi:hypothetical protein